MLSRAAALSGCLMLLSQGAEAESDTSAVPRPELSYQQLCSVCHDWQAHSTHPIGPEVVDMRNQNLTMDCSSCHRSHGTEFEHLSHFDPSGPLCVECHEQFGR